ncbi:MAG TPA: DUF6221 family protein [Streptosporangiaceae bacterium]|jgi:hypothetical protein|nr:DUF6221 family protein [Streptosporangiaceae bacterium]
MVDPVEFAAARLSEDEAAARAKPVARWRSFCLWIMDGMVYLTREDAALAARMRRDVEAGRRILARHRDCLGGSGYCGDGGHSWDYGAGCWEMADLLSRWSDHPDYQRKWTDGWHEWS